MTVVNKIDYLIRSLDIGDRKFARKYHIRYSNLKKWRNSSLKPCKTELIFLCDAFELSIDDFMDDTSTISYLDIQKGEHLCARKSQENIKETVNEDYPFEDNARYEEKD